MRYFFRRARRRTASLRWGVIFTAMALCLYAIVNGRANESMTFYVMVPVIVAFLLVFAFAVELFRTATLVFDEPMAHLIPVAERKALVAIAVSLVESGILYVLVNEATTWFMAWALSEPLSWDTLWHTARAAMPQFGAMVLTGLLQLLHFVSLVLCVQMVRRVLDQHRHHSGSLPYIVMRVLDLFISVIFWVLSYAVALVVERSFPWVVDVQAWVLAPLSDMASSGVALLNWAVAGAGTSQGLFLSLPIVFFLVAMTIFQFAVCWSLVEDHIDW